VFLQSPQQMVRDAGVERARMIEEDINVKIPHGTGGPPVIKKLVILSVLAKDLARASKPIHPAPRLTGSGCLLRID
jgi:hypothetical protein